MKLLIVTVTLFVIFFFAAWLVMISWNGGVVPATGANEVGYGTAMWLTLFISLIGGSSRVGKNE